MIRYSTTRADLERRIERAYHGWLADAAKRASAIVKNGRYSEKRGSWGRIKRAFMELQFGKCAYCERQLEAGPLGRIEHDLEHFRPKAGVKAWPADTGGGPALFGFPLGGASARGYFKLAYEPFNYAAACKVCNTPLKHNYFPIRKRRRTDLRDLVALRSEEPLLIYPLGTIDDDPELLIGFVGLVPVPRLRPGSYRHQRALVTIRMFRLDTRESLLRERAERIQLFWLAYRLSRAKAIGAAERAQALEAIDRLTDGSSPHANCVRSFRVLLSRKPREARAVYQRIATYLRENS